jgi:hypothetical protein
MTFPSRLEPPTPRLKPDFRPDTVYCNSYCSYAPVAANLEVRTVEALNEVAWRERISRASLLEEIVVAYLRDCFPDRTLPTREESQFDDVEDRGARRLLEHDELGWRSRAHQGRKPRDRAGLAHRSLGRVRAEASE